MLVVEEPAIKYNRVVEKQSRGEHIYHWEARHLKIPLWQQELNVDGITISYSALKVAYDKEILDQIEGMGPKYVEFVGQVLSDIQELAELKSISH